MIPKVHWIVEKGKSNRYHFPSVTRKAPISEKNIFNPPEFRVFLLICPPNDEPWFMVQPWYYLTCRNCRSRNADSRSVQGASKGFLYSERADQLQTSPLSLLVSPAASTYLFERYIWQADCLWSIAIASTPSLYFRLLEIRSSFLKYLRRVPAQSPFQFLPSSMLLIAISEGRKKKERLGASFLVLPNWCSCQTLYLWRFLYNRWHKFA